MRNCEMFYARMRKITVAIVTARIIKSNNTLFKLLKLNCRSYASVELTCELNKISRFSLPGYAVDFNLNCTPTISAFENEHSCCTFLLRRLIDLSMIGLRKKGETQFYIFLLLIELIPHSRAKMWPL